MTDLKVSKSILAKLLAAENITVCHRNTSTAYFDLKTRTLVCPVWNEMDGDLYDLLMGHEVGHALETPEKGWHNAIEEVSSSGFKSFLNVIEDARIEKLMKRKYPGLSKSFMKGYKDLYERDFFGIKNVPINKLNLIDRINLKFKIGAYIYVPFNNKQELDFVAEVEAAETWEQVEDIAKRIHKYIKSQEKDKVNDAETLAETIQDLTEQMKSFVEDEDDNFSDDEDEYSTEEAESEESEEEAQAGKSDNTDEDAEGTEKDEEEEGGEESEGESEQEDTSANESAPEEDEKPRGNKTQKQEEDVGADDDEETTDAPVESVTDKSFRAREAELVNESGVVEMFYLPEANLEKIIIKNSVVMDSIEGLIRRQAALPNLPYGRHDVPYETIVSKCVRKFNTTNKKYIMHMAKEFDMRKKAASYAREQTAKTGELDTNVVHKYKFTSDLFKKIKVVPKGKNHGIILYLDMSGSMRDIFRSTIEQLLIFVSFCKVVNIPVEVYGFNNHHCAFSSLEQAKDVRENSWVLDENADVGIRADSFSGQVVAPAFNLKHLIGTSLSPKEYRRSFGVLATVMNEYNRERDYFLGVNQKDNDHGLFPHQDWQNSQFALNGTPYIETLLSSREMIKEFRKKHDLHFVNVIYLTDGDGSTRLSFPAEKKEIIYSATKKPMIYLVDKKTKMKVKLESRTKGKSTECVQQEAITELVRRVTGCKHIGYYVGDNRHINYSLQRSYGHSYERYLDMKKDLRKHGFVACESLGYDKYFYVTARTNTIEQEELEVNGNMSASKMASAFKKAQTNKKASRVLLSKFAEEITALL